MGDQELSSPPPPPRAKQQRRLAPSHPLWELTRSRLLEFVREPETIFWVFVFPVLVAIALGIAFRVRPPDPFRVGLVGADRAVEHAAELLRAAPSVQAQRLSPPQAAAGLRTGKIDISVSALSAPGDPPSRADASGLVLRFDPTRPEGRAARLAVDDALQRAAGRADVLRIEEEHATAQGGRYIDFLIPGLVGLNIMGSAMWGIGYSVVLARRHKLLKRLAATPMRRSHYLLSWMLSRLLFLVPEVAVLLVFGWIVFGVRIHGSLLGLGLVALLGSLCFMGLALLVASRTSSTEAASGWMNAIQLPMWLLSGSFFSYERFPELSHPFIRLLPLTAFNDALRALVNEGATLGAVAWPVTVLGGWSALTFVLALKLFRWT